MHIIVLALIGLGLATLQNIYFEKPHIAAISAVAFALTAGALWLSKHAQQQWASTLFSLTLFGMIASIHWTYSGIYDSGMMLYPALIIFTGLLCAPWLFTLQFVLIMLNISLLVLAEAQGWRTSQITPAGWSYWIDAALIMSTVAIGVGLVMKDFRQALSALRAENQRVSKSQKRHRISGNA